MLLTLLSQAVDAYPAMNKDLRKILDGWRYEPGKISVRKIIGRDGHPKIQTRVDLGVLQMEPAGRPDGERPHSCTSYLDYFEQRLRRYISRHGRDDGFALSVDDCRELKYESHIYYQRYLSLFVLEEFDAVVRDTAHNLRTIELVARYARRPDDRAYFDDRRAYVTMMLVRGQTYLALGRQAFEEALASVESGLDELEELAAQAGDEDADMPPPSCEHEIGVLRELREEVLSRLPSDAPARLKTELAAALAEEDYERAARLRDRLRR